MPKVYIDPGHGGYDSGAVGNGYLEKNIVLEIAKRLNDKLKNTPNFLTRLSRTDDTFKSLSYRASDSNNWGADIFISIHANSADTPKAKGLETYAFAERYNKLATCVQNSLLTSGLPYTNRGVKYANFQVLRETKANACLIETGFISNAEDISILTKYDTIAEGIYKGILDFFKISYSPKPTKPKTLYYVFTNCYSLKENAHKEVQELNKKGIKAYIKEVD